MPRNLLTVLAGVAVNEDHMPKLYLKLAITLSASGAVIFMLRVMHMIITGRLGSSGVFSYAEIAVELVKVVGCLAVLVIAVRHLRQSGKGGSLFDELRKPHR